MHSTFATSTLVRLLARWTPVEDEASGTDTAERMSRWFGPLDAIRLHAVKQSTPPNTMPVGTPPKAAAQRARAIAEDVQRVRGVLAKAISQDPLALAHIAPGEDAGYAPWQQRHAELQRQMSQMLGALRDHVRQAVSAAAPRLRPLVAMDAAFDELLAAREQALLPTTATLLERRFHQLRAAHRQALEAAGQDDDATQWRQPGGWLHTFAHDWRQALLAELELRLEPVMGLLDALRNESGIQQA